MMSGRAVVGLPDGNCYINDEVIKRMQSYSDAVYEGAVKTFAYHNYLYDTQCYKEDDEACRNIQRIPNRQFHLSSQLMDESNVYFRDHYIPWKERLITERNSLRDRCDWQFSVFDFTYPGYGFHRNNVDNVWWHLKVYHTCCEAYHFCQFVEARFMYNSRYLVDSTDNLAQTVATVYCLPFID
jgi:hypothetical protein